jgi:hypothetical protein
MAFSPLGATQGVGKPQSYYLTLFPLLWISKMPKPKQKPKWKPKAEAPEEPVDKTTLNFLSLLGILGLILIIAGIASIFLVSVLIGVGLIVVGIAVYVLFFIMEKRLKVI